MTAQFEEAAIQDELAALNTGDRLAVSSICKAFEVGQFASQSTDSGFIRLRYSIGAIQVDWFVHEGKRIFTITAHNREHAVRIWAKGAGGTFSKGRGEVVEVLA